MTSRIFVAATAALLATAGAANAQSQQQNPAGQNDILGNLLGSIFGNQATTEQTLETDWNQGERPFAQRRETLDARIEAGLRDGSIDRRDADEMRREYDDIVATEARYSANGNMATEERRELRQRYRAMTDRFGDDRQTASNGGYDQNSNQGGYQSIAARRGDFDARVLAAERNRRITPASAQRLRRDFLALVQIENQYRQGGLSAREQADLAARFDALDRRLAGSGFGDDRNPARWTGVEARIAAAERAGRMNRTAAAQLRTELGDLTRLDNAYAANGFSADERTYLSRRFTEVDARARVQTR